MMSSGTWRRPTSTSRVSGRVPIQSCDGLSPWVRIRTIISVMSTSVSPSATVITKGSEVSDISHPAIPRSPPIASCVGTLEHISTSRIACSRPGPTAFLFSDTASNLPRPM